MTDTQFDEIRKAALVILAQIGTPDEQHEVNQFLAELQPYPEYIIRIVEVP